MDQHLTRKPEVNFLCDLADSVLCVIDFQSKLAESMTRKAVERMMQNVKILLHTAEILKVPVIASEQSRQMLGDMLNEIIDCLP